MNPFIRALDLAWSLTVRGIAWYLDNIESRPIEVR